MCSAPSPKVDQSAVDAQKKQPQYLSNPWLDGLAIQNNGMSAGRNSLVLAPGTAAPATTTGTKSPYVGTNTNLGIGAGGGFAGGTRNLFGGLITVGSGGAIGGPLGSRMHKV